LVEKLKTFGTFAKKNDLAKLYNEFMNFIGGTIKNYNLSSFCSIRSRGFLETEDLSSQTLVSYFLIKMKS